MLAPFVLASSVWRAEGMRGFYRGYFAAIVQNAPSSALWWSSYGYYRKAMLRGMGSAGVGGKKAAAGGAQPRPGQAPGHNKFAADGAPSSGPKAAQGSEFGGWRERVCESVSGAMAGTTVAVLGNPLDVIRTRVQVEGGTVSGVTREMLAQEGVSALGKGITARIWMLAPNGAVIMTAYELIKRLSAKDAE